MPRSGYLGREVIHEFVVLGSRFHQSVLEVLVHRVVVVQGQLPRIQERYFCRHTLWVEIAVISTSQETVHANYLCIVKMIDI